MNNRELQDELRRAYVEKIKEMLGVQGEQVLMIKNNVLTFPVLDGEQNERWINITIQVPRAPFDGFTEAQGFAQETKLKEQKAAQKAEIKAKKVKKDAENRQKTAENV